MTKEELKKEAIQYAVDYPTSYGKGYKHKDLRIAYLAGAEPREKQIQIDAEQIKALQKQNGELTDELVKKADTNHQLVEQMAKLSEENAELKKWQKDTIKARGNDYMDWSRMKDQLTKAKQFIRDFLSVAVDYICPIDKNYSLITEAEQFIKEE